jgi:hypothetical protein
MKNNSHDRRLVRRDTLRKATAGQLPEAEAKAALAAEVTRKDAKPAAPLNRKQRKSKRSAARNAK